MWSTEVFSTVTDIQFVPGSSPRACWRCWREQRSTYRSVTLASYVGRPCRWTPPTSSSSPRGLSTAWTASSVAGRQRRWVVGRGLGGVGSWHFLHTVNRYLFGGQGAWQCRIMALWIATCLVVKGLGSVGSWHFSHTMNHCLFGVQEAWWCRIMALLTHNESLPVWCAGGLVV